MPRHDGSTTARSAPLQAQLLRLGAVSSAAAYYHLAYRVRGWGNLPRRRGSSLLVANHQHDIEAAVIVASLSLATWSWRHPIFTVSSRRMWEPGFMAERIPWLAFALRTVNAGPLFSAIGLQPIENGLRSRPFVSLAQSLYQEHGDLVLRDVFRERALELVPARARLLSDLLKPAFFHTGRRAVSLSDLREPYRSECLAATRGQLEADLAHFERLQRDGATIFSTPEGFYSGDGRMQRLRGVLSRLAPYARIWIVGISYDPFVGRRLSMLYRVVPSVDGLALEAQIKRTRPVVTSALLGAWLEGRSSSFTQREAIEAVQRQFRALPALFVDPELRRSPPHMTRAALGGLMRLGILTRHGDRYRLSDRRVHPQFPRTSDIISYQANFHRETLEGAVMLPAEGIEKALPREVKR